MLGVWNNSEGEGGPTVKEYQRADEHNSTWTGIYPDFFSFFFQSLAGLGEARGLRYKHLRD